MPRLRDLLDRARKLASDNLPPELADAGRRLRDELARRVPEPIAKTLAGARGRDASGEAARADEGGGDEASTSEVRRRALEDAQVVIYTRGREHEGEVVTIREALTGVDALVRVMDLDRERPQVATQIAALTGKMVPPYVYIRGRYWGAEYEMVALRASGDLAKIVAGRTELISAEARRIGGVRGSYSDELTAENILERWRAGHILCVDDLDAWYEVDRDGQERFFYEGGPRSVEAMATIAAEIAAACERGEIEARWQLEPSVQIG